LFAGFTRIQTAIDRPSPADGVVGISAAQLGYMLDGIDWRNPRQTFRPRCAG
jgi:transposase